MACSTSDGPTAFYGGDTNSDVEQNFGIARNDSIVGAAGAANGFDIPNFL